METVRSFTLEKHEGPYESWPERTRLLFDGKDTGRTVPGYVIEGQYKAEDSYLLITSRDCPFEESNDFLLLNDSFDIVAREALVPWFNSYLINTHWPISTRAIRIHYYDGAFYDLGIEENVYFGVKKFKLKLERIDDYTDDKRSQDAVVDLQMRLLKTHAASEENGLKIEDAPTFDLWQQTWKNLGATTIDETMLRRLIVEYAKYQRSYHTYSHIVDCFKKFAKVAHLADHPDEIRIALWFHDAIYDSKRADNELKSAELARDVALNSGVARDVADRIYDLILATRHDAIPAEDDQKLLVDVDLSILGAEPQIFDEYERQVRWEYRWVPEVLFLRKRRGILRQFLNRTQIFNTKAFHDELEQKARQNLSRSISKIDDVTLKKTVRQYAFPLFMAIGILALLLLRIFRFRLF